MPPRYQSTLLSFEEKLRNLADLAGQPGHRGHARIGAGLNRGGTGSLIEIADAGISATGAAQLLVLSVTADSIASGGDYVAFDQILEQRGFDDVASPSGGAWVHPISAVYTIDYEHTWATYEGGGTIELELDGEVATSRRIASGSSGGRGRGSLSYFADRGSVGKVKVTQDSGAAQTCSASAWVAMPDPTEQADAAAPVSGSATVILFVDGVQVASASGDVGASFSAATMLLGVTADDPSASSDYHFDQAEVMRLGSNLVSNDGFESALAGSGTSTAVTTGNWRAYVKGTSTVARVTSPVHTGTYALRANVAGGTNQGSYAFQDIAALAPGEVFEVGAMVRPSGSGTQVVGLVFDWDRVAAAPWTAIVEMTSSATSFSAFGLSGSASALPAGTWSEVVLRVGVVA